MQVIYAFIAMLLVALLSLTLQRGIHSTERRQIVNEVSTQLVGVGIDVLEYIGRHPFDYAVDTSRVDLDAIDDFPYVTNASQLTPPGSFGGCTNYYTCQHIDDFEGVTITRNVDGFDYVVDIFVRYVDENSPDTPSAVPTFAKEVRVEISSTHLYISSPAYPLTVLIARVFTYEQPTKA